MQAGEIGQALAHVAVNGLAVRDQSHQILHAQRQPRQAVIFGNRHIDQHIGFERIVVDVSLLQRLGLRNVHGHKLHTRHDHHLAAGRFHLFGNAADFIRFFSGSAKGIVHHAHAARAGFQAHLHQRAHHPRIRRRGIFVSVIGHADVGLDDHVGIARHEAFHAAQRGDGAPHHRFRLTRSRHDEIRRDSPESTVGCDVAGALASAVGAGGWCGRRRQRSWLGRLNGTCRRRRCAFHSRRTPSRTD